MKAVLKTIAVLAAVGCGAVGKDKLPESSGNGADAIPAESQVQFDTDLTFEGRLAQERGLPSATPFVFEQEYLLLLTQDAAMRLQPGEIATACPSGASLAGVHFTLTSSDGLFRATTDTVARPATPMAEHAFPGRVPKGTHVLKVSAYGTGACTVHRTFKFPNLGGDDGFETPDPAAPLDQGLLGSWRANDFMNGVPSVSLYSFGGDRRVTRELRLDGVAAIQWSGKLELDVHQRPRRARLTVTAVTKAAAPDAPSVGDVFRCIYYGEPSDAPVEMTWQCSAKNDEIFPDNFDDDAESYDRTATGGSAVEDFRIDKDAPALAVPIPDADPMGVHQKFNVATTGTRVLAVGVNVRAYHPHTGDLRVKLTHPDGTEILLQAPPGTAGTTLNKTWGLGGTAVPDLAILVGRPLNGQWTVTVADEAANDAGTLDYVRLVISGQY